MPDHPLRAEELQSNPEVMNAAQDIATNGEAAAQKYASNPKVMDYLLKLEKVMGGML